jgi:hypothetical protein
MQLLTKGVLLQVENVYEKEIVEGKKVDTYKGFKPEGKVVLSNVEGVKKGDIIQVNPYGGSEIGTLGTKKHRFLVVEERDLLIKL